MGGMTNEQFNSYKLRLLRELEYAWAEIEEKKEPHILWQLIEDLRGELKIVIN